MDIAVSTLEDLYEDTGGLPNTLTLPHLEDVKEDANKITISNIRQGMGVMISSLDPSSYDVPDMKKTAGLNGIVLSTDKVLTASVVLRGTRTCKRQQCIESRFRMSGK